MQKLRLNENKQTDYTKKIKRNPCWKCVEARNKCNSMIITKGVDHAWYDKQYENQIPSQWHK